MTARFVLSFLGGFDKGLAVRLLRVSIVFKALILALTVFVDSRSLKYAASYGMGVLQASLGLPVLIVWGSSYSPQKARLTMAK